MRPQILLWPNANTGQIWGWEDRYDVGSRGVQGVPAVLFTGLLSPFLIPLGSPPCPLPSPTPWACLLRGDASESSHLYAMGYVRDCPLLGSFKFAHLGQLLAKDGGLREDESLAPQPLVEWDSTDDLQSRVLHPDQAEITEAWPVLPASSSSLSCSPLPAGVSESTSWANLWHQNPPLGVYFWASYRR